MTKNYRKPDQYYEDLYDRSTILELKQLEKENKKNLIIPEYRLGNLKVGPSYNPDTPFYERGVQLAQNKRDVVSTWKQADEEKDRKLSMNPPPKRMCPLCGVELMFKSLLHRNHDGTWLYIYDCPVMKNHRRIFYMDGSEYFVPKPTCKFCGGEMQSRSRRTKYKQVDKDLCLSCGQLIVYEFDLTPDEPIKEEDRDKYCKYFEGKLTAKQQVEQLLNVVGEIVKKQRSQEEDRTVSKIQILTIVQLEQRLITALAKLKYRKFQLDTPQPGRYLSVGFSMQEEAGKSEKECIKEINKLFNKDLLSTNWRVMKGSTSYQLGFISGKIRGYQSEEDLLKLAQEIIKVEKGDE